MELDYSLQLEQIIDNQEQIIEILTSISQFVQASNSALLTYAIMLVPLMLIICALWWFFKQFIR